MQAYTALGQPKLAEAALQEVRSGAENPRQHRSATSSWPGRNWPWCNTNPTSPCNAVSSCSQPLPNGQGKLKSALFRGSGSARARRSPRWAGQRRRSRSWRRPGVERKCSSICLCSGRSSVLLGECTRDRGAWRRRSKYSPRLVRG